MRLKLSMRFMMLLGAMRTCRWASDYAYLFDLKTVRSFLCLAVVQFIVVLDLISMQQS